MATRADEIIDRRRLRRKLTFWRVLAVLLVALGVAATASWTMRDRFGGAAINHIAKIKIEGTITENDELLERLERIRESAVVKGVILSIDSPGGTTAGGEAIFEAVRKITEEKPVVAQIGTLAASAGYMVASAADHIVSRQSSIVGSIGVLIQFPNVTELMDNLGVELDSVKSSPLKAEPSPFTPTTDEEREMLRALVMDSYEWFVGLVDERRPLSRGEVLAVADGSIFTGRQALENKLVDELGGEAEAVAWLETQGVDPDLGVVEWKPTDQGGLFGALSQSDIAARLFGAETIAAQLIRELGAERIFLDGLLSVWQPDPSALGD